MSNVNRHDFDYVIKILMVISIAIMIFGSAFIVSQMQSGLPTYDPLTSSDTVPSTEDVWENVGDLSISARLQCDIWDTHQTDRFQVGLILRINNTGPVSVPDFRPVKLSIFRDDHWHYFTFGLIPAVNSTIHPFSNVSLLYQGDRTLNTLEGITPNIGTISAYGRILISIGSHETIVTTSLFQDYFPIE
jgi:hypothetical protein